MSDGIVAPHHGGSITVAVTGGIGSGKSTVAAGLAALGAVLVDSDRLAREVLAPGTPGLAEVAAVFGPQVLTAEGALDRAALAAIVFADTGARRQLEVITHPRVRASFDAVRRAAPAGSVVLNDIPLLTTPEVAASFHLVVGVGADVDVRIARLRGRGMTADDARSRIAAQIDDSARRGLCDLWIDNDLDRGELERQVASLWPRLSAFAGNVAAGQRAVRGRPVLVPPDPEWPAIARRLMARIRHAVGDLRIDHEGSTAVPGFPAKDVIDLQLAVVDLEQADQLVPALEAAGFPQIKGLHDTPHSEDPDPEHWRKNLHANADPGQGVNLHVRVRDTPAWRWSLRFRDWLRADAGARAEYLAVKRGAEAAHGTIAGYAEAKEAFMAAADGRCIEWAAGTGWTPGNGS